jgi:type I restriction enzyme S subunit
MNKVKFGELFDYKKKSKIKAGDGLKLNKGSYPFYTSSNKLSKSIDEFQFSNPSLIFGTGGMPSVHFCEDKFAVSTDCLVAQPKDISKIYVPYSYYFFTQNNMRLLQEGFKGAGLKHISRNYIDKIQIPLPPLKTQKQIASILDNAAALCDKTAQLLKEYDLLAQSIFLEMFGDPGINNKKHFSTNIKNICKVKGGKRIPKGESLVKNKTMHPYIKAGNIKKGKITTTDLEYLTEDLFKKISRYTVEENDVCITVVGANIGDVGIVPQELHLANLTENANKLLIIDKQKLNYMYLAYYLMSNFFQTQIDNNIRAAGVPKLAIFRIEETRILVPPINLQNQFAEKIALIEKQKALAKQELQESEDLFNCLLQKAFKGELV